MPGWGNAYATTTYFEHKYTLGTLILDVSDAQSKDQIWKAEAKGTAQEDPARRDRTIPKSVNMLMSQSPVEPV